MSFYGKETEAETPAQKSRFFYLMPGAEIASSVVADSVYFYESGHVGFWEEPDDGERKLVLAVKALDVWED